MPHAADAPRGPDAADVTTRVGFIGLGAMGSRLAGRLLDAGHPVYATNRTAANTQPLIDRGRKPLEGGRGFEYVAPVAARCR
jgi:3-hydroxyisobutyrate dehydrogenase-like beta-hydroxyacid dehydrogenase